MAISINKQIRDIKNKGIKEIFKKFIFFILLLKTLEFWKNKIIYMPLALIVFIILLIIKPIKNIRLGVLHRRLGHFFLNTELYLLEKKK